MARITSLALVVTGWILGLWAGCESAEPANPLPADGERQEIAAVLAGAARGHQSAFELRPAGARGRWSDVPDALRWAIAEEGVEMGLIATHEMQDGYLFELVTVEGWPATLAIRQVDGPRVYAAAAQVGRFPEIIDRSEREAALLRAFDEWMAALGAKPQPVPIRR
jgi:hypothetical protein